MINLNAYSVVQYGDDVITLHGHGSHLEFNGITKRDWALVRELVCPVCRKELVEPKKNSRLLMCHVCKILFTLGRGK